MRYPSALRAAIVALALSTLFEGYRWTWIAVLGVVLAVVGNCVALMPARTRTVR